jgi:hypothetical protein
MINIVNKNTSSFLSERYNRAKPLYQILYSGRISSITIVLLLILSVFFSITSSFTKSYADGPTVPTYTSVSANMNTPLPVVLRGHFDDPRSGGLTFTVFQPSPGSSDLCEHGPGPCHGSLSSIMRINETSAYITYTPNHDFVGDDHINFKANDGFSDSGGGKIQIEVISSRPVVDDGSVTTDEDVRTMIPMLGHDQGNRELRFIIDSGPASGHLGDIRRISREIQRDQSLTFAEVTYLPNPGYSGSDVITYHANTGSLNSQPGTIRIRINPPPLANNQHVTANAGHQVDIPLTGSSRSSNPSPLTLVPLYSPTHGTLGTPRPTGPNSATVIYTPNTPDFTGTDSFTFEARERADLHSQPATVTIRVNPVATATTTTNSHPQRVSTGHNSSPSHTQQPQQPQQQNTPNNPLPDLGNVLSGLTNNLPPQLQEQMRQEQQMRQQQLQLQQQQIRIQDMQMGRLNGSLPAATAATSSSSPSSSSVSAGSQQQQVNQNITNLTNDSGLNLSILPRIAVSGSNAYVVWQGSEISNQQQLASPSLNSSKKTSQSSALDIFFKASKDNGAKFGKAINLSNNTGASISPQVAVSGSNVYVVWADDSTGNAETLFKASKDNGATFGKAINLSNNTGASISPQVAVSGSNVYVVWADDSTGNAEIAFVKSTDNGATFGKAINLSKTPGISISPEIAVSEDGSNVYVVWGDNTVGQGDILFQRISTSAINGTSPGTIINLSTNPGLSISPQISASGNNVYVVWQDTTLGRNDIAFVKSTDNGAAFGKTINNLSNNTVAGGDAVNPHVKSVGGNVYVVWEEHSLPQTEIYSPPQADIMFTASKDNGAGFISAANISNDTGISISPQISVSESGGGNVYVVWQDSDPKLVGTSSAYDILMISIPISNIDNNNNRTSGRSLDSSIFNLSQSSNPSILQQIAVSGSNVYVAWTEITPTGGSDILFTKRLSTATIQQSPSSSLPSSSSQKQQQQQKQLGSPGQFTVP